MRLFGLVLILLISATAWPLKAEQDGSITAFYGRWGGSAIAKNSDSIYFGVTIRDLDVTIAGAPNGFNIAWTTVFRRGGTPNKPKIRRKTTRMSFTETTPGVYQAWGASRAGPGGTYSWARYDGKTLHIYMLAIDNSGVYQLSSYARTVTGSGMDLEFSAIRDGEALRSVTGRLVKHQ